MDREQTPPTSPKPRAIRPVAIALGVFGLIAALATLVISAQVISRLIRRNAPEAAIVRALGAGPATVMADRVLGVLGAIGAGSVLAVGVAVALSPLAPIGPVRPVYPDIDVSFDWTVLGFGFLSFVVALTVAALVIAHRWRRTDWQRGRCSLPGIPPGTAGGRGRPPPERGLGHPLSLWASRSGTARLLCALHCSVP